MNDRAPGSRVEEWSLRNRLRQVHRDAGVLIAGNVSGRFLRFVAAIILARALGASDFGLFNVAIAVAGTTGVVCSLGLPDIAAREVAVRPGEIADINSQVVTARLGMSIAVSALGVTAVALAAPQYVNLAFGAAALVLVGSVTPEWVLRGLGRMKPLAVALSVAGAGAALAAVITLSADVGPGLALAGFALAEVAGAVVCWWACRESFLKLGARGLRHMIREAWPVAVAGIAVSIYLGNFDTVVLALVGSTREAGVYSAAYRIYLTLNIVAVFAAYASYPTLSRLYREAGTRAWAGELLAATADRLLAYGAAVVGGAIVMGGPMLGLLFGPEFRGAEDVFILLAASLAWYAVTYPAGYALIADRRPVSYMAGTLAGCVSNVVLCLLLIPNHGALGAGIATLVSVGAAGLVWLERQALGGRWARWPLMLLTMITGLAIAAAAIPQAKIAIGTAILAGSALASWRLILQRHPDDPWQGVSPGSEVDSEIIPDQQNA